MNRATRWILAIIGIILAACSLLIIYMSGKPISTPSNIMACIGFVIGFLILMTLLYSLSVKVGIAYTILLLLLFLLFFVDWDTAKKFISEKMDHIHWQIETASETENIKNEQLDENGNIVIEHPYDDLISLQWGTLNNVDMDLILIDNKDNVTISFHNQQYSLDDNNSIWLDYDYQEQNNIAKKEVISILGMQDRTFSVLVVNYNGETLKQDAIVVITLADGRTKTYTLPAQRFNDDTDGIYVCDIIAQSSEIIEIMQDFSESEANYR